MTAGHVLGAIDVSYLWRWGHGQLVVQKRESLVGRLGSSREEFRNSFRLAWCYWSLGCFEESLAEWDRAIQLADQNDDLLNKAFCQHNKALVHWDLGELRQSLQLLERAAPLIMKFAAKENQAGLLSDRGIVCLDLGLVAEAMRFLRDAERLAGEARADGAQVDAFRIHADALGNLALASLLTGDVEEARKWADLALAIPIEQVGHFNTSYNLVTRARVLLTQGQYRAAIDDCEAAIDLEESSLRYRAAVYMAVAHAFLGESETSLERARQAVKWTRPLLARDKCSRDAPYFMGLALLCAAQGEEALGAYQKGLIVCSAEGVVRNALLDLRLLDKLPQPPQGTARAVSLLDGALPDSTSWHAASD